ncbi:monosaccharide ABC transporter substrate-binding protein, CUT2 family [Nakamurella panacisegetis]|uniref:Monosaccharide ABC transporter substrate-binding protein, CUT2 family n=1 Tax=Nakamurella panacisegetis TaxID=1090615 RepID=A0A1H0K8P0_9ACTN|nr:ABC transporter substrate-binding protein [Nakamurella panacisegetis]SDO52163.1 monosaccharide ABC transporter substrate-binding protein, CUT2 family [Nakamurella panacisegetis]
MKRSLVLGVAASAAMALVLAGCSSSKPSDASSTSSAAAATSAAASAPAVVSSSAAPASSAAGSSAAGSSAAGSSSAGSSAAAPTKASKNYKISFIQGVAGDNFYITMQCGIQTEAAKLGVTVNTQGATKFDPTLQTPILDSVVSSKPDAILIAPTDVKAMQAPLAKAAAAGIKIVLVDTTVNDPSFAVSQVSSDNVGGGKAAFTAIKGLQPKGGKVLVISVDPGISTTDARVAGFETATKADSSFNYLGVQYSHNDPATAASLVTAALQKDPDIVGIFATNLFAAEGAATGIKQAGKSGKVSIVGFDAGPDQIKALKAGTVQALVAQQPDTIGVDGLDQAVAGLDGGKVTPKIQTGFSIITSANVDSTTAAYKAAC